MRPEPVPVATSSSVIRISAVQKLVDKRCFRAVRYRLGADHAPDDDGSHNIPGAFFRSRNDLSFEVAALRLQLIVLKRKCPRPRLRRTDRIFWVALRRLWSRWSEALIIIQPETVVGWHRAGFRLFWRWRSRAAKFGRPTTTPEIRQLIRRMAQENPGWGAPKNPWRASETGIRPHSTKRSKSCSSELGPPKGRERSNSATL